MSQHSAAFVFLLIVPLTSNPSDFTHSDPAVHILLLKHCVSSSRHRHRDAVCVHAGVSLL